jgi:hypothetical protein
METLERYFILFHTNIKNFCISWETNFYLFIVTIQKQMKNSISLTNKIFNEQFLTGPKR